ncbi:MAG: replicative DNA helicase [Bacilli bacterium]|jgi:replicative DNA helicase|nr:replicative DNA helicase [Bacilli bacterium]
MRALPFNEEAEQMVLGAAILSRNAIDEMLAKLNKEDFYLPNHQIIFEAISEIVDERMSINISTLTTFLVEKKQLENVGGVDYLSKISQAVVSSANTNYYIDIVLDKSLLRNLINTSEQIASEAYEQIETTDDLLAKAEKDILDIIRNRKTTDFKTSRQIVNEVHDEIIALSNSNVELTGVQTGYDYLDRITSGFQKGDLIILAARPSVGKTAFALNIANNVAKLNKVPVAIFSLEMGAEQLVKRMLSAEGGINGDSLKNGKFKDDLEFEAYRVAQHRLAQRKIYIDDTSGIRVSEIASKCRKLDREENGIGLIVIDYLQLIAGSDNKRESRQVEVSDISRSLKLLARELNVPVIALSQLSRSVEQRGDKRPLMSDLRESGAIEQDADIVAFLYREDYYNHETNDDKEALPNPHAGEVELIIGKHRNGSTGTVFLHFEKENNRFTNLVKEYE